MVPQNTQDIIIIIITVNLASSSSSSSPHASKGRTKPSYIHTEAMNCLHIFPQT